MRECKYRGYAVDEMLDGQWIEGFGINTVHYADGTKEYILYTENGVYQVHKKSIGQYTGLEDANGVPICEGDILQASNNEKGYYRVVWYDGGFVKEYRFIRYYQGESWEEVSRTPIHPSSFKVVGNAFENSEMLIPYDSKK